MQLRKQNMQTVFHRQTMRWLLYLAAKIHPFKRWVCHKAALRFDPVNQSPVIDYLAIKERVAQIPCHEISGYGNIAWLKYAVMGTLRC